jgi:hypothetical protein
MKATDLYETTSTTDLQSLLLKTETTFENGQILLDLFDDDGDTDYEIIKKKCIDCEIDISLIRMELNRRLYNDEF